MPEYNIKVQLEQKTFIFLSSEDQDIISAANINGVDLPNSCCSGLCTDCIHDIGRICRSRRCYGIK